MKTNLNTVGTSLVLVIISMFFQSCTVVPSGPPGQMNGPMNMARPMALPNQINSMPPGGGNPSDQQRIRGAQAFMSITGTEKLSPLEANAGIYRSIISGGRFRRDPDGVISQSVLLVIASGGVIGWSGSSFGFEPTVREVTKVTEMLSVNDVALACVKYQKLPSPQSQSGRLVRARAMQIEQGRGYILR